MKFGIKAEKHGHTEGATSLHTAVEGQMRIHGEAISAGVVEAQEKAHKGRDSPQPHPSEHG